MSIVDDINPAAAHRSHIHKAGIIDEIFMVGSNGISQIADLRNLGEKSKILINGELVRSLIDPVIPIGYDLIGAIDDWLFAHK